MKRISKLYSETISKAPKNQVSDQKKLNKLRKVYEHQSHAFNIPQVKRKKVSSVPKIHKK